MTNIPLDGDNKGVFATIPEEYRPISQIVCPHHVTYSGNGFNVSVHGNGDLRIVSNGTHSLTSSITCYCSLFYPLANPKF